GPLRVDHALDAQRTPHADADGPPVLSLSTPERSRLFRSRPEPVPAAAAKAPTPRLLRGRDRPAPGRGRRVALLGGLAALPTGRATRTRPALLGQRVARVDAAPLPDCRRPHGL